MALAVGMRLGPYEVLAPLGAGGMGEVYKARDTRLDRLVAIKVLSEQLAGDAQFRQRFAHEARAISALDHPHICSLYDVGDDHDTAFLVMQYLDGETLADRLVHGPLPVTDALTIAIQMASALDKAHRAGIIHRDLKPGNVMLTNTGAKLLDFGLAKTAAPLGSAQGLSMLPTTPPGLTAQGTILGTFQYMAPEQLEGQEADARTDLFAFGAVLFEMVTGKKAFEGTSHASLISAIMSSHPPLVSLVQPVAPYSLARVIHTCLAKKREDRFQSAHDLMLQLQWIAEPGHDAEPSVTAKRSRDPVAWTVAGVALLAAIASLVVLLITRPADTAAAPASTFVILPPDKATLQSDVLSQAISPDGRQIVFGVAGADGKQLLWIRSLDSLTPRPLAGTEEGRNPFWSPDGRSIGFFTSNKLKRVDALGGPPQTLADASLGLGGAWGPDGTILFTPNLGKSLYRVPATGGEATPVLGSNTSGPEPFQMAASFLPDGRHFVFLAPDASGARTDIYAGELGSKETKRLFPSPSAAVYASGHLLFLRESSLMAVPFDPDRLATTGDPVRIAEQVGNFYSLVGFSASANGALLYRSATGGQSELVWMDRAGKRIEVAAPSGSYQNIALSADGKRVAFDRNGQSGTDIWLTDLQRHITSRLTFKSANVPTWSPDGSIVAFASFADTGLDIGQKLSNGGGPEQTLLKLNAGAIMFPSDWSTDGRYLTYYRTDAKTQNDVWVLPLFGDRKPFALLNGPFNEAQSQFSPDGKWVAYISDESGTQQVYVQSFPSLTAKWQISTEGGTQPRWRRDGQELFYLALNRKLMTVTVKTAPTFEAETPHPLFDTALAVNDLRQTYAVSSDGQRLLLNNPIGAGAPPLTIVLNWPSLLRK
jgi:eukaryotic-like serine/threonine-protein kinase